MNLLDTLLESIHQVDTAYKNAKIFSADANKSKIPSQMLPNMKFVIASGINPIAKIRFR